jgi:TRAP-type C4-dicarboxylate transport system permease small subunit
MDVRMTWPYLAIPVGSLLMVIQLLTPEDRENDHEATR